MHEHTDESTLPERYPLKGAYLQYKENTSVFVKWLVATSATCGFCAQTKARPNSSVQLNETPAKSGRFKGKARKEAKHAADAEAQRKTEDMERSVSLPDLVSCAKAVVSQGPKSKTMMPKTVLRAGMEAISVRKEFSTWYHKHASFEERSNNGHIHFTAKLEHIMSLLSSCIPQIKKPRKPTSDTHDSAAPTCAFNLNMFEGLSVEEPAVDDTANIVSSTSTIVQPQSKGSSYKIECPENEKHSFEEEKMFAVHCLFKDLGEILKHSKDTWGKYRDEKIDHMSASLTVTIATELARHLIASFEESFPECDTYLKVVQALVPDMNVEHRESVMNSLNSHKNLHAKIFWEPFHALCTYRYVTRETWIALEHDDDTDAMASSWWRLMSEYHFIALQPSIIPMLMHFKHWAGADAVASFLQPPMVTSMKSVFAWELLFGVFQVLGQEPGKGYQDLTQILWVDQVCDHNQGVKT